MLSAAADKHNWCPLAEQAISLTYRLAEHPDIICADIIKQQATALLAPKHQGSARLDLNTLAI